MDTEVADPFAPHAERIAAQIAAAVAAVLDRPVIAPGAFNEEAAASYVAKSRAWLESRRAKDAQALAEGRAPLGPPARFDGAGTVFYVRRELDDWLARLPRERPKRKEVA